MYVARETGADWTVIGLGETQAEAMEEPVGNGYDQSEITVTEISEEQYAEYLDLYT